MFSHRFHGSTQIVWVRKILPQISQIYTDGLSAKDPPTDCTEFTEPSAGDNLPQISQIYTDCLGVFKGVHLSPLGFAACQSKKCTNRAKTDCLLVKFNNGLNGLNGFVGCVDGCVDLTTD